MSKHNSEPEIIGGTEANRRKQEIHLECPPGEPRPGDLIANLIANTGLPIRKDSGGRLYGHWSWNYSTVAPEVWEAARSIVLERMSELYEAGTVRAASFGEFSKPE
jgi:hypothetical protein